MKEYIAKVENEDIESKLEYRFDNHNGSFSCILFEDDEYIARVGNEYKTIKACVKVAKKHAEERNYIVDFDSVIKEF